jgi:3D (Asp-Asp-Asp) domain-containing protein
MTTTSNPITFNFVALGPMRTPTPGGQSQLVQTYTLSYPFNVTTTMKSNPNNIAAFGMSCYMIALESDYGTPPNSCSSTRINGVRYSGSVTNPNGLTGTYCSAFIANVKLQGTGQLNSGTYINYSPATGNMTAVSSVTGADGTPVVAGQTVARDRAIIPGVGVLIDIDGIGTGLLANDTGGAITGYRLDLYNGAGVAACANYPNPIAVGTCNPVQTGTCPGSALQ